MSAVDKGGCAFPVGNGCGPDAGMTLRDYFAATAMQALILNQAGKTMDPQTPEFAYDWADAMLRARKTD